MFARKCNACGNTSYCAANLEEWVCPYCGEPVPRTDPEEEGLRPAVRHEER
ncbi:MAG: hypothetical protein ACOX8W_07515 [bacterium]|jgi:predicted RNA-binding Zn-ribbon protein involved in translation (DUF1610 family)